MSDLQEARKRINEIDEQMAHLFEERMDAVAKVADYKLQRGLPVYDKDREKEVLDKNTAFLTKDAYQPYYTLFQQSVMNVSKNYQRKLIEGLHIAYCGVEGAYGHIVTRRVFPQGRPVSYPNFAAAYHAVEEGECDCLVLPIENSFAGQVGDNIDLIFEGTLYITGIYELPIQHYLLGVKGAKEEDIKTVISHEQALEQCGTYIDEHNLECQAYRNTAIAAKAVADKQDKALGAIASKETAELYGLDILAEKINDSNLNTTRFAVLSRKKNDKQRIQGHFVMMFTVSHQAGALAQAIDIIGKYGFNMEAIKSRTLKGELWQYYFYTEIEGNPYGRSGEAMVEDLKEYCDHVRIIGTYDAHVVI